MFTIFTCRFSLANRHRLVYLAIITVICFAGSICTAIKIQGFIVIRYRLVAQPKVRHYHSIMDNYNPLPVILTKSL